MSPDRTRTSQNSEQPTTIGQDQQLSGGPSSGNASTGSTSTLQSTRNNGTGTTSSGSPPVNPRGNPPRDTEAVVDNHPKPPSQAGDTTSYAAIQKKRQQEAREERARILALVESDKERRRKDAERKANPNNQLTEERSAESREKGSSIPAPAPKAQHCALQIRLFDGSSIRSKFPNTSTLNGDVRKVI